jgi:hypothetical protein
MFTVHPRARWICTSHIGHGLSREISVTALVTKSLVSYATVRYRDSLGLWFRPELFPLCLHGTRRHECIERGREQKAKAYADHGRLAK